MKKNLLALTFLLSVSLIPVMGQLYNYQIIPYRKGKLWGYCDSAKTILLKPAYEETRWFYIFKAENGLAEQQVAVVKKNGKLGLIDQKGKLLVACQYDYAEPVSYERGINFVRDRKSFFYRLANREMVFIADLPENWNRLEKMMMYPVRYPITQIAPGKFRVVQEKPVGNNGTYSYIRTDSMDYEADSLYQFADHNGTDSAFFIVKNGKKGLITLGGRQLLPSVFDSLVRIPTDYELGNESVFCLQQGRWEIAYPFAKGAAAGTLPHLVTGEVHFGSGYSKLHNKTAQGWGVISSNGSTIIPALYDSVVNLNYDEVYAMKKNGRWQIKRPDNRAVNLRYYKDVKAGKNLYMYAQREDGIWVLLPEIDREIFPHKKLYESYHPFFLDFLSVYKDKEGQERLGWAHINGTCYWE